MKSINRAVLWTGTALALLGGAFAPLAASAAAVSVTALTATSTPVFVNTGLATTSRAKVGDTVQFQLNLGGTPLVAPQINIFGMGSTTMSGSVANFWYSTTTSSSWTEGPISFKISVGGTAGDATSTPTQANITSGSNVTFDKTGPTLSSVSWTDQDGSTEFSSGDKFVFTFNETMATTTIATGNADTTLGLNNSHTFGTTPTIAWNTAGTQLTLTLTSNFTVASGDTVDPSSAVKDAIGNIDATPSPVAITDNLGPASAPTGLVDTSFASFANISLTTPAGAVAVRYTTDGTSPTCSSTLYSSTFQVTSTVTVKAIACDTVGNVSSIASAVYTKFSHGGGGGGGGTRHNGSGSATTVTTTTTTSASLTDLLAKVAQLKAALAALTGTADAGGAGTYNRNLDVGISGPDVTALQNWLIGKGFAIAAGATGFFGAQTKGALAAWQSANGISPAVGFFGPLTRAAIGH